MKKFYVNYISHNLGTAYQNYPLKLNIIIKISAQCSVSKINEKNLNFILDTGNT